MDFLNCVISRLYILIFFAKQFSNFLLCIPKYISIYEGLFSAMFRLAKLCNELILRTVITKLPICRPYIVIVLIMRDHQYEINQSINQFINMHTSNVHASVRI